eukprot:6918_1
MTPLIGQPSENIRYILCYFLCGCSWLIFVILAYCLYIFNKIKALIIYKKRYPLVVKMECFMCLFMCSITWPVWVLHASQFTSFNEGTYFGLNALFVLNHFMYPFVGHAVTFMEAGRLWVMYYKINRMNAVLNNQWESAIDSTSMMRNWYILHHATFGSLRWVMKRVFLCYIFAATTSMILITNFGFTAYTQCVDCVFYGVPILFILYLYCTLLRKKTLVHDNFLFYLEFKTTNMVFPVGVFLYAFTPFAFLLDAYYAKMWTATLGVSILTGPSLISALYIPGKILNNSVWSTSDRTKLTDPDTPSPGSSFASSPPSSLSTSHVSTVGIARPKRVSLDDVFSNRVYTQYFIQHIIKEFSLECTLSFIEMRQFGYCLYTELKAVDVHLCSDPAIHMNDVEPFEPHIPHSTIVSLKAMDGMESKDKVMRHFKDIFVCLCEKYIDDTAPYQVNISYELKDRYDCFKAMHKTDSWNVNETELLGVFHDVLLEMRQFMSTSLIRFVRSVEWEQIYQK